MIFSLQKQFAEEVDRGQRFEFGKNWRKFLSGMSSERILLAERSLQRSLKLQSLEGKTFLDVGSGSGLFSLAARRLGARVVSFDYDPQSVSCTNELRHRYFKNDADWEIKRGSVLDPGFLAGIGTFDIVYAWGVLHHTGSMWTAVTNVMQLVRPGGRLFLALYNDQGEITERWKRTKKLYNSLWWPWRDAFAICVIFKNELVSFRDHLRAWDFGGYVREWVEYPKTTARGMSRWYDWIDWIGGYPYECACVEDVVDFVGRQGFKLIYLDQTKGYGCNEFVFHRVEKGSISVENDLLNSRFIARRIGLSVSGPFRRTESGFIGILPDQLRTKSATNLILFRNGSLIGSVSPGKQAGEIIIASDNAPNAELEASVFQIVSGTIVALPKPFTRRSGKMFVVSVPDLEEIADNAPGRLDGSPVVVFEDARQLSFPHSIHREIAKFGAGRFSHWGAEILFSTSDNSNPNDNGRTYRLLVPEGYQLGNCQRDITVEQQDKVQKPLPIRSAKRLFNSAKRFFHSAARIKTQAIWFRDRARTQLSNGLRNFYWSRQAQPLVDRRGSALARVLASPSEFPYRISRPISERVVLGISSLYSGGAERQTIYMSQVLAKLGYDVHLLVEHLSCDEERFYLKQAQESCASVTEVPKATNLNFEWLIQNSELTSVMHLELGNRILNIAEYLADKRPAIVHLSLDWTNVTAGLAAALAGVPSIVLAGRNVAPLHFSFFQWFMYPAYRALLEQSNVCLINNTAAGARDYAKWLRMPPAAIRIIRNGFDASRFRAPTDIQRQAARKKLGISNDTKLIFGAFRLAEEKRPLLWLRTAAEIYRADKRIKFVLYGSGPLEHQMIQLASKLGISDHVLFSGLVFDMPEALAAADVVMLTSSKEGTPNILIEAQAMGIPVVATAAHGSIEAVSDGVTARIVYSSSPKSIAKEVVEFINSSASRSRATREGPYFVEKLFGLDRLGSDLKALYNSIGARASDHA